MKYLSFILLFFVVALGAYSQRTLHTLNSAWKFSRTNPHHAESSNLDDSRWESVNIPHSWNEDAYQTRNYYRGTAWYRKYFEVDQDRTDKQIFIKFEGVNVTAEVYLNGRFVTKHEGGYSAFTIDATPYLSDEGANLLAVKVDNSLQDLPPLSADFSMFGGIYRDVWLIETSKQHVDLLNYGSNGVFIQTPKVAENSAEITVKGEVSNDAEESVRVKVVNQLLSPEGELVQQMEEILSLQPRTKKSFEVKNCKIASPELWSPESPVLYQMKTRIVDPKTNKLLDEVVNPVGFRWFSFDGVNGFFLNGKPLKLIGVCRHQDQYPLANALSDEMHRRDLLLTKEMGANFIRISHYPQDPAILEYCDKLGLLAWEEIPIVNTINDTEHFRQVSESNLVEMIRQHYNHPSVIMWGYMNEAALVTVRRIPEKDRPAVYKATEELAKRLEKVLKAEDPHRVSTIAFHNNQVYHQIGLSSITDVIGWNLYFGWYDGNMERLDQFMKKEHEKYPHLPLILSEYGAGSDRRINSLQPEIFDFSVEYQQVYHEYYLPFIYNTPYMSGSTVWNFIDFGSADRDESMPYINNKGLLYTDRTPKDVFYYYKAFLRKDVPVLHIASRDWQKRTAVANGDKPVELPVKVYSNCDEVELWLNGRSLGVKKTDNCHAVWMVPFSEENNVFSAKSTYRGQEVSDAMQIEFRAVPAVLTPDNLKGLELAVNVGSNASYTSAESGLTWVSDRAYTEGGWGYIGGEIFRPSKTKVGTQTAIGGTSDDPLFQTARKGIEAYKLDVPAGTYEVELLFADIFSTKQQAVYLLEDASPNESKSNVFEVEANGKVLVKKTNFVREFGNYWAVKERFTIEVKGEEGILLKFLSTEGITFLNGLKIRLVS